MNIILTLIVLGVVLYLIGLIPMDATIMTLIRVVVIIFAVFLVLGAFGAPVPHF